MKLAENIRAYRRARSLTQEQLAEVLGVTVYKWEARLSLPELNLLIEMADFFDVSVDALLGYEMKGNRPGAPRWPGWSAAATPGKDDRQGLAEAEKALKKYPHDFAGGVRTAASLYLCLRRVGPGRPAAVVQRALRLLEDAPCC